jgi:hypothetical protein
MKLEIALVRGPLFLAAVLLAGVVRADVIELKTGQRVEGTLTQTTSVSVVVEVGGQTITFDREKVRAIYFGAAPAASLAQPSARDEAMKALKGLRSVAQGGIAYRDYAPRVSDAKIVVDRYLGEGQESPDRAPIRESMEYYVYAASAWNSSVSRSGYEEIAVNPLMQRCQPLMAELGRSQRDDALLWRSTDPRMRLMTAGILIGSRGVPIIWACAADKITEAEKLLGVTKP